MTDEPTSHLNSDQVERLHAEHAESLRRYLISVVKNRQDAEDCLQSTFAILQQKGGGCAEGSRKAWLFRVAYNEAMQLFRRRRTSDIEETDNLERQITDAAATPEYDAIRKEQADRVRNAVRSLPDELQEVVTLRIHEGLRFREIADRLNIPLGTALTRMQSALKKLNNLLDE